MLLLAQAGYAWNAWLLSLRLARACFGRKLASALLTGAATPRALAPLEPEGRPASPPVASPGHLDVCLKPLGQPLVISAHPPTVFYS